MFNTNKQTSEKNHTAVFLFPIEPLSVIAVHKAYKDTSMTERMAAKQHVSEKLNNYACIEEYKPNGQQIISASSLMPPQGN